MAEPLERELSGTLPVLIMLLGCCTQGLLSDCPRMCDCRWRGGKEAVSCVGGNYSSVPLNLDIGTQLLDMSGNNLMRLKEDDFSKAGLLNLQKVYLVKCRLKLIDRNAFRYLNNLVELDLTQNFLHAVPSYIFHTMPELRELKLNENPIQRINNEAFLDVPKLERVEMTNCKIGTIEEKAFEGIEQSLQWLKLDGNQLSQIRAITFESMKKIHGLELAGNPWNCTCVLRSFRDWMIHQNIPFEIPPTCKYPKRLAMKSWKNLELDEFACVPKINVPDPKAHGVEGSDITITCTINSIPESNVRWHLKNRIIANQTNVSFSSGKKQYVVHMHNNSSNLTIQTADVQDAGVYICSAENKAGRVEASVTLAVSRKISDELMSNKSIIAGVVIAVIFVSALTLLLVCIYSIRWRRQANFWYGGRTTNGRRHEENYEKIEMSKFSGDNANDTGLMVSVSGDLPAKRNGDYRVVPSRDDDQEEEEEEDNMESPGNRNRDTKLWTAAASGRSISSPNSGHWNSNFCESNIDSDDFSQKSKDDIRDICNKNRISTFGTYKTKDSTIRDLIDQFSEKSPKNVLLTSISQSIQPHIMKKQILSNNGSLYTSVPISSELEKLAYSELARNPGVYTLKENAGGFMTNSDATKRRSNFGKIRTRVESCDSESPLLPRSRYSSSGESSLGGRISTRRFSEDSIYLDNKFLDTNQRSNSYLSLVTTKPNLYNSPDSTPLLNIGALELHLEERKENYLSSSSNASLPSSRRNQFNDQAMQLESFLDGYRNVNNQLNNMKEICDKLKRKQEEDNYIRTGVFKDSLLLSTNYQDSNPKSILKKSISTLSTMPSYSTHHNSSSSSPSASIDFNKDGSTYTPNQFDERNRYY